MANLLNSKNTLIITQKNLVKISSSHPPGQIICMLYQLEFGMTCNVFERTRALRIERMGADF